MILFDMKLFSQLPINGFNYLPNLVNPPLGLSGELRSLVAAGDGYQINTVDLSQLLFDLGADIGFIANHLLIVVSTEQFIANR